MRFWSQNLNEKGKGVLGSMWREGRCCLYLDSEARTAFNFSWALWSSFHMVGIGLDLATHDNVFSVSLHLYKVHFWFSFEYWKWQNWLSDKIKRKDKKYGHGRSLGLEYYQGGIRLNLWQDPMEFRGVDPKWWGMHLDLPDFFLGCSKYAKTELSTEHTQISLPEGNYPSKIVFLSESWTRPRWPWPTTRVSAEITPKTPVPVPGKGENAWDCEDDAVHSMGTSASTVSEAVGKFTQSILRDRERYGGKNWLPPKFPVSTKV